MLSFICGRGFFGYLLHLMELSNSSLAKSVSIALLNSISTHFLAEGNLMSLQPSLVSSFLDSLFVFVLGSLFNKSLSASLLLGTSMARELDASEMSTALSDFVGSSLSLTLLLDSTHSQISHSAITLVSLFNSSCNIHEILCLSPNLSFCPSRDLGERCICLTPRYS